MGYFTTVTSKGQVTLPAKLRKALGIQPGDRIELTLEGDEARLRRTTRSFEDLRGIVSIERSAESIDRWVEEARSRSDRRGLR